MEESCGGSPVLAAPETDLALSSGDIRDRQNSRRCQPPLPPPASSIKAICHNRQPAPFFLLPWLQRAPSGSHLRAIFPKCEGGPGLGTQGCPGDPGVATLSEGLLSARAFPCAVRGSRQLSTRLSPALLCGGSSEAPWPVQGPLAGQQLSGNRN